MLKCFVMLCNKQTEPICLEHNLFAAGDMQWVRDIHVGDLGFLYNFQSQELMGVFKATSEPGNNLVTPNPFGGHWFTFQFRVTLVTNQVIRKNGVTVFGDAEVRLGDNEMPRGGPVYTGKRAHNLLSHFPVDQSTILAKEGGDNLPSGGAFPTPDLTGFADVVGLDEAKKFIHNRMVAPLDNHELAEEYGLRLGGGLLLFGPPGTGKTRLAEAVAREINAEYEEVSPSIIRGFPGEAECEIEKKFQRLHRDIPRAVLFFDEAEALFPSSDENQSTVMQRVIPVLLNQFAKLSRIRKPILVIGATNRPWDIGNAFLRPGRFGKIFYVKLPSFEERKKLLEFFLKKRESKVDFSDIDCMRDDLAQKMAGYSGADIEQVLDEAAYLAFCARGKILSSHIETTIQSTPPSVSSNAIKEFDEWDCKRKRNRENK